MKKLILLLQISSTLLLTECTKTKSEQKNDQKPSAKLNEIHLDAYIANNGSTAVTGHSACFKSDAYGATTFHWDFGDGTTSSSEAPCHIFTKEGLYIVKLTLDNTDSISANTRVIVRTDPAVPAILFGMKTWYPTIYMAGSIDTTFTAAPSSFAITYIDPLTINVDGGLLYFQSIDTQHLKTVYNYGYAKQGPGSSMHQKDLRLLHGSNSDSIIYISYTASPAVRHTIYYVAQ